ncbi:MAG: 3-dehydroquinate synthase [Mobiluncus porci]|uniref:3-dehydroquinate synthase n=1 Tax=Mobiluncus porci TaxID=2652278 RepID=UPI0023F150F1|nr:3-dehydroquinate synthase [Mobiluncus porci]MDD7541852.1 3-dehydroquinate synthase [Mobiluncus porci]MDY5748700.1 3-dehydroquinate synthase [Mobiluncus porci]
MTRKIVLIGLPTSGKSKTAGLLAQALHADWVDTDLVIEQRFGKKIPWIFREIGEDGFRCLEYQVVKDALSGPARIVSLGGGAPTFPATRNLLAGHTVYYLKASPDFLSDRQEQRSQKSAKKKTAQVRPLLAGDARQRMRELYDGRKDIYEKIASVVIDAEKKRQEMAADIIAAESSAGDTVWVQGAKPYRVVFGEDLAGEVADLVPARARKILILAAPPVVSLAEELAQNLTSVEGREVKVMVLPDGEAAKQLPVLSSVWDAAAAFEMERGDLIIPLGGGATTDLGGFAAATWLRGIDVLQVPTTLLAMVDAAIGGKTGIDWTTGKNLVGAFHPPVGVAVDFTTLQTLPRENVIEGLAEALKCGFIRDPEILEIAREAGSDLTAVDSPRLREVIFRAVQVKAAVVSEDLYESGLREYLNYGHTLAHAIEKAEDFRFPHGLAVAIGIVFAAHLGALLGIGPRDLPRTVVERLEAVGLPTTYSGKTFTELKPLMYADKKVRGGELRFVLLEEIGRPTVVPVSATDALQEAARLTGIEP